MIISNFFAMTLESHDLMVQESLPFIQEACQSNSGVDNKETERKNDVSSFKAEDLIHEEHEDPEEKETQAEDKTEADEGMEIAIAGYPATEQVNNLT